MASLPGFYEAPVGQLLVALEAKAAMTAHSKAAPRLYDELNSSHQIVHGSSSAALAVGSVLVNIADRFRSPTQSSGRPNQHRQPDDAKTIIDKVMQLPRRARQINEGFDALGILVVACTNEPGDPVLPWNVLPAPQPGDPYSYDSSIARIVGEYSQRFAQL